MSKILIFGTGSYFEKKREAIEGDIIGFIDNNKDGYFLGHPIYKPKEIVNLEYDYIYICVSTKFLLSVVNQLFELNVDCTKIIFAQNLKPYTNWERMYFNAEDNFFLDGQRLVYNNGKAKVYLTEENETVGIIEMLGGNVYGYGGNNEKSVVVDIGMNIGIASLYFASREDVLKVYAYEPFPGTYERAMENLSLNPELAKKITSVNAGISDGNHTEKILYNPTMHVALTTCPEFVDKAKEFYKKNGANYRPVDSSVEVSLVDAAIELGKIIYNNTGKKMILKIDCEGSEYGILDKLEKNNLLNKFSIIMLEWHFGGTEKIENNLKNAGFSFFKFPINNDIGTMYAVNVNRT